VPAATGTANSTSAIAAQLQYEYLNEAPEHKTCIMSSSEYLIVCQTTVLKSVMELML
jgi:hypothetical protein